MSKNKIYAYYLKDENSNGITTSWDECKAVMKDKSARCKSFKTEKEAFDWLKNGAEYSNNPQKSILKPGIYFDSGTGRGIGVEVRVTDENAQSLLPIIAPKEYINEFGNYLAPEGSTNNYGELFGCYSALKIAIKQGKKEIFGDSRLILDYWSKGYVKNKDLPKATTNLIEIVKKLRIEFEKSGGTISYISGDDNPADLGFHK